MRWALLIGLLAAASLATAADRWDPVLKEAKKLVPRAKSMLATNKDRSNWNYGNVVHNANQVLGLAALANKDVKTAAHYLMLAGKSPGSPQLDTFGPPMHLAQALLDRGYPKPVLQYLDLVAKFWAKPGGGQLQEKISARHAKELADWRALIRGGRKPSLNFMQAGPARIPLLD